MKLKILCLFLILQMGCQEGKQEAKKTPVEVLASQVIVKDTQLFHRYVGHIEPFIQVEVKAQVEGELTDVLFKEGDEVGEGDLIFKIDSRPYEAQLAKAKAALAQNIANLRYAQEVVRRNEELAKKDYVSQIEYEKYQTEALLYEGAIEENQADIERAKIHISYCNIHSPIHSVTGKLQIQQGNLVQNAQETPLVYLNQIQPIYAYFSVPQKDLPKLMQIHRKKKMGVEAFLNGEEKNPYKGTLDLIDNQVDNQSGSIWLRGVFANEEKMLWPGEFVEIHLLTEKKKGAMLVPTESVTLGQKGKFVFVIEEDQKVYIRYIEVGQRIGEMTVIEKGIQPDDLIVTEGQINLGNGTKVVVKSDKSGSKI